MLANLSSNANLSAPPPYLPPITSDLPLDIYCFMNEPSSFIVTSYEITNILLLPLYVFILHHGLQQWRGPSSLARKLSHSDCITYHVVAMELVGVLGCVLNSCGIFTKQLPIFYVGFYLYSFTWFGQIFFHVLMCVERYLAVVHPITYLRLRQKKGIRVRNMSIACVWLLSFVMTTLLMEKIYVFVYFFIMTSSLLIVSFCSLSVLCVLIRPGPGERADDRKRFNQSKKRAFCIIVAILGVLLVRFAWSLVWALFTLLEKSVDCMKLISDVWFNLPSNLVLPLLFLHRAGKLSCCKKLSSER